MRGTKIGPFAEIGFAENDCAGGAQPRGDEGILRSVPIGEGERPGGGGGAVARFDVVLEQNRNAVQRSAQVAVLSFLIELGGGCGGIRIQGEYRAERGAVAIDRIDTPQIKLHKMRRGPLALFQAGGDVGELTSSSSKLGIALEEAEAAAGTY